MSYDPLVSPPHSFEGYSFRVWLARNKGKIKQLISISLGIVTAMLPQIKDTTLSIAAGAAVKVLSDLGLDAVDFWFSETPKG